MRKLGFNISLGYHDHKAAWDDFLQTLDPQTACRLCGIDHFPHWLAAAANFKLLSEYLGQRFPDLPVREALAAVIRERRPDPKSEKARWWLKMQHVVADLEKFAYLYTTDQITPRSQKMMDEAQWCIPGQRLYA